ncbi:MAG TPA: hydrogenase expression/formation protein HypE [bacterium]
MSERPPLSLACPLPITETPQILLAHGGGGKLMRQLIERVFVPAFGGSPERLHDGAVLGVNGTRVALTTDSYVVRPWKFPGGDIGSLAVHGTVNDLAMCGAKPVALTVGFILEEGFPMASLWEVVRSMREASASAGVDIVTGDTKVVDRGKGDGIYLNTAGLGLVPPGVVIGPDRIRPGDVVLLSGDIGRHGIAIMAVREGLEFESAIESDSAPLAGLVAALVEAGIEVHCLRDLTRGGLASALVELAQSARVPLAVDEAAVPVREEVRGACEMLGLDPLYVANEGRFVAFVAPQDAPRAAALMRAHPLGQQAVEIGRVAGDTPGLVSLKSAIGSSRILDMLSGEQLPRIC